MSLTIILGLNIITGTRKNIIKILGWQ